MSDNGFGANDNPWDDDPSKKAKDTSPDEMGSAYTSPPMQPEPTMPTPMQAAIPMPPPPPIAAPGVGTYYGNQTGYGVSGPTNDGLAIASMVVGILGLIGFCFWFISGILDILAIVLGGVSLSRISKSNGYLGGKGFAIAGLVCGILGIIFSVLFWSLILFDYNRGWY